MGAFGWFLAGAVLVAACIGFPRYVRARGQDLTWKNTGMAVLSYLLAVFTVNVAYLCFWENQYEAGFKLGAILAVCTLICLYVLYRLLHQPQKAA